VTLHINASFSSFCGHVILILSLDGETTIVFETIISGDDFITSLTSEPFEYSGSKEAAIAGFLLSKMISASCENLSSRSLYRCMNTLRKDEEISFSLSLSLRFQGTSYMFSPTCVSSDIERGLLPISLLFDISTLVVYSA